MKRWLVPALLLSACQPLYDPFDIDRRGGIAGLVVDEAGAPLAGMPIWVQGTATATVADRRGRFVLSHMNAGALTVLGMGSGLGFTLSTAVLADRVRDVGEIVATATECIGGVTRAFPSGDSSPVEARAIGSPLWVWSGADGSFQMSVPPRSCHRLRLVGANLEDLDTESRCAITATACGDNQPVYRMKARPAPEPRVWLRLRPMPFAVSDVAAARDGAHLYVAAGHSRQGAPPVRFRPGQTELVHRLDFTSGEWRRLADLPWPRSGARGAILDGLLYVIGGWYAVDGAGPKTCRDDDQVAPRYLAAGDDCNGGCELCATAAVSRYDPATDRWSRHARLLRPRAWPSVVASSRALYAFGGLDHEPNRDGASEGGYLNVVEVFKPSEGGWNDFDSRFARGVYQQVSCLAASRLFVFGGLLHHESVPLDPEYYRTMKSYDFDLGAWDEARGVPAPEGRRTYAGCATLGRFVYVNGSYAPGELRQERVLVFDTETSTWSSAEAVVSWGVPEAIATPHGFVLVGSGGFYGPQGTEAWTSVAERFVTDALSRYATPLVNAR